uniref:uncharacterized protein LOC122591843 n=1 Tax=Erigeron canadensis TaxID=72917 RepID=UPI001CB8B4F8|nr:uncharacterized protein LOC122591843 [Erigeron canadensis]
MQKHIGSTTIIDEPFEWSDDSSLEVFANAIESEEAESSTARSHAKRKVVNRNRWTASERLHRDYFCEEPKYDDDFFEYTYRMPKRLFLKIVQDLESRYAYFQDSYDARLAKSFTPIQKCTSAIRQLTTGNPPDEYDEYLEMAGRTSRECLQIFCDAIVDTYKTEYLRKPTTHDLHRLFEAHEERHHLPGMIAYKYPTDEKEKMFKTAQEAARKDIERAFGVLKGKWHIIDRPFRQRSLGTIRNLVYACVILHNMIIQDSGRAICPVYIGDPVVRPSSHWDALPEIQDEETHFRLRYDLTDHLAGLNLPHLQPNDDDE